MADQQQTGEPRGVDPSATGPERLRVRKPEALNLSRLEPKLEKALPSFVEAGLRTLFRQEKAEDALIKGLSELGVKIAQSPGERAWLLLTRALARAAARAALPLLMSDFDGPDSEWRAPLAKLGADLARTLDAALQREAYMLSADLRERPRLVPGLNDCRAPLAAWLHDNVYFPPEQAEAAAARLPELFVHAAFDEWNLHAADYQPIEAALQSGPSAAVEREVAWSRYRAHLQEQYRKPLFGTETFGVELRLPELYIDLRAWYLPRAQSAAGRRGEPGADERKRRVVWLEETLDAWLKDPHATSFRVLGGGPGAGKSSFLKRYAARVSARAERPVVFVELHLAEIDGDLPSLVRSYLERSGLLKHDPLDLDIGEPKLLVILDGLDELEQSGRPGQAAAQRVLKEVRTFTELRRRSEQDVRVLLSGREVIVGAVADDLPSRDQVLHLLPFRVTEEASWNDPNNLRAQDQRPLWWERLSARTGKAEQMPAGLDEITAEPLLNYLVALAQATGRLPEGKTIILNQVYAALVDEVWERRWGNYRGPRLERDDFFEVLEEIALATWHGNGRGAGLDTICAYCEEARLTPLLERLHAEARPGVMSLLGMFFFGPKEHDRERNSCFEFTHKSFGEYFLARRLTLTVVQTHKKRREYAAARRGDDGWPVKEALRRWAWLCGPALLSEKAAEFLYGEIAQSTQAAEWQQTLSELADCCLEAGGMPEVPTRKLPGSEEQNLSDFSEAMQYARNAESALLVALAGCAMATELPSGLHTRDNSRLAIWLGRLEPAFGAYRLVLDYGLRGIEMEETHLSRKWLYRAKLNGANLRKVYLHSAWVDGASLNDASLEGGCLTRSSFEWAQLSRACLKEAQLSFASLEYASLLDVNMEGADLRAASLEGALLYRANLRSADLQRANLTGADMRDVDLTGANLEGAYYNELTIWPDGFDPTARGAIFIR